MTMPKASHPTDDVDRLYVLKTKDTEDLPALNITFMHRNND